MTFKNKKLTKDLNLNQWLVESIVKHNIMMVEFDFTLCIARSKKYL